MPSGPWWRRSAAGSTLVPTAGLRRLRRRMDNPVVKRLLWSGLLAGLGSVATIVTTRVATLIWVKVFDEDPPVDF